LRVTACVTVKMLSFSPDADLESLAPLVCHLFDIVLFQVGPDIQQSLLQLSQVTHWLLLHTLAIFEGKYI